MSKNPSKFLGPDPVADDCQNLSVSFSEFLVQDTSLAKFSGWSDR